MVNLKSKKDFSFHLYQLRTNPNDYSHNTSKFCSTHESSRWARTLSWCLEICEEICHIIRKFEICFAKYNRLCILPFMCKTFEVFYMRLNINSEISSDRIPGYYSGSRLTQRKGVKHLSVYGLKWTTKKWTIIIEKICQNMDIQGIVIFKMAFMTGSNYAQSTKSCFHNNHLFWIGKTSDIEFKQNVFLTFGHCLKIKCTHSYFDCYF